MPGVSLGRIIADLNPMLRGWFGYFQYVVPSEFRALDGFIRRRLRAVLRKQEKRPGFGRNLNTITAGPTPSSRSMETLPMRNPTTGEPCAGKPHARFAGRGGQKPSLPPYLRKTHPYSRASRGPDNRASA